MTRQTRPLLRWQPLPRPYPEIAMIGARRDHHVYIITQGPNGVGASYKSHLPGQQASRFIASETGGALASVDDAKTRCEHDYRRLTGRLH